MPRRVLRNVLVTIVLSRALVFFFLVIGSQIAFLGKEYDNAIWHTQIDMSAERLRPELTRMAMVGDAWFYERIARDGYEQPGDDGKPRNTWAFFPLFPLLVRTSDFAIGAMVLSNLAFAAGLLLVAAAALRVGASEDQVERAVFFIAFFPTSYFFSLPMTEALFLCLSAAAFLFAARGWWWAAGVAGALAAATRFTGVLLFPALWLMPGKTRDKAWLLLIPASTAAFMLYLQRLTGDALAFVHAQVLWGRGALQLPFAVSRPWNFVLLNVAAAVFVLIAGIALLRQRQWAFGVYTLLAVAVPLSTGSVQSMARYAMVVFPAFLWLAAKTEKSERWVTAVFVALLGWMLTLFVLRVDLALA